MKIYFTASLHSGVGKDVYQKITSILERIGHKTLADHIIKTNADEIDKSTSEERTNYYREMKKSISSSDMMVCEVSFPSTISIGHEVTLALDKGKPVLALYQKGKEPGILQGIKSDRFLLMEYTHDDLEEVLEYGLEDATEKVDVRFNFFISPKISSFLDLVAKKKKTPRAVYLRRLIEKDMEDNKEYNAD